MRKVVTAACILSFLCVPSLLKAQAPGVAIVEQSAQGMQNENKQIDLQIKELLEKGELLVTEEVQELLKRPQGEPIVLQAPSEIVLETNEIAQYAKKSVYRVGIAYLCGKCDMWHLNLGGGYALSDDGVLATCAHCLELKKDLKDQTLIAIDMAGKVYPVRSILAYDAEMDGAIVKIETQTIPLALSDQVRPGDPCYCLSRPMNQRQYFSRGIVNRFYWNSSDRGEDDLSLDSLAHLRINVSTDWAPGSSGSPILDQRGNVIGHVASINLMGDLKKKPYRGAYIAIHNGIPARSVNKLASSMKFQKALSEIRATSEAESEPTEARASDDSQEE